MKKRIFLLLYVLSILLCILFVLSVPAEKGDYTVSAFPELRRPAATQQRTGPVFPQALSMAYIDTLREKERERVYSAPTREEAENIPETTEDMLQSVLLNNDIVAFYGNPLTPKMGILGQYALPALDPLLTDFANIYDKANGEKRGVIPALYIIYGTCWPEGEIGTLKSSLVKQYIEYAAKRGWYVFLDHQIGKYSVESAVNELLPWLKYPNVHLALDPEWRTTKPMMEIGSVTAEEINRAQEMIEVYLNEHNLSGRRFLVIHQFKPKMISNRPEVRSTFDRIQLILCADGFGPPAMKRETYAYNALATNIPLKSFKLFTPTVVEGAGYDIPLMTPDQVLSLDPRPYLIMIQ